MTRKRLRDLRDPLMTPPSWRTGSKFSDQEELEAELAAEREGMLAPADPAEDDERDWRDAA